MPDDVQNSDEVQSIYAIHARAHGYNVHHDIDGWYVICPGECEPESGYSLGFDGRRHYPICRDAWVYASHLARQDWLKGRR